ncbi:hypothetical protein DMC30DRAFT_417227 [Rhodotorula diobovata]|uniref:Uncharacterized protein n=1 Tax=Rhodotorula diobovata TaxID=5288 RepID=A0A5C5FVX3_9BASI|nr:hypothetical protein DMC30DRAFT_417227 [Rhodotorula diobovata]
MSNNPNTALAEAQFASLSDKTSSDFRAQGTTSLDDESGVTDGGLGEFQKYGAAVEVGRTGQSGGGDNMNIPPEQGGDPRTHGSHASHFDNVPAGEDKDSWLAKNQPGQINLSGQQEERAATIDAPKDGKPQLEEQ